MRKFGQETTYFEASPRTSPPESIFKYFSGISGHFRGHDAGEVRAAQRLSPVAAAIWQVGARQCAQCAAFVRGSVRAQMPLLLILAAAGTGVPESGSEEEEGEECGAGKWQSSRRWDDFDHLVILTK